MKNIDKIKFNGKNIVFFIINRIFYFLIFIEDLTELTLLKIFNFHYKNCGLIRFLVKIRLLLFKIYFKI